MTWGEMVALSYPCAECGAAPGEACRVDCTAEVSAHASWPRYETEQPLALFVAPDPLGTLDMFGDLA